MPFYILGENDELKDECWKLWSLH